jgi:hypothetical protein
MPFDSTLNVSSHAFAFGSPDIVPLFAHDAPERIEVESYAEHEEDFSKGASPRVSRERERRGGGQGEVRKSARRAGENEWLCAG